MMLDCYLSICFEYFCSNVAMKVRRIYHMTIAFVRWRSPHSCIPFTLIANHMTGRMVGNVFLVFRICGTWEDDYTLRRVNQLNNSSNSKQQCVWNENERSQWREIKNAAPKRKIGFFSQNFFSGVIQTFVFRCGCCCCWSILSNAKNSFLVRSLILCLLNSFAMQYQRLILKWKKNLIYKNRKAIYFVFFFFDVQYSHLKKKTMLQNVREICFGGF